MLMPENSNEIFKLLIEKGTVFLNQFDIPADHKKFFIVAGHSPDKIITCAVYINSNIHTALYKNQILLNLQVNIKGVKYSFLKHDSFVCCSTPLFITTDNIMKWINDNRCKYIGCIDSEDLENITDTLIDSGLLTDEEIELFFS
ncbi:MAG: hypothetical protein LBC47_05370 [Tannerella sp.]|nr:hypothetical protein [Tannerella sp.]